MLKRRLIPALFLKNGFLVRSEAFSIHQNLGNPVEQVSRYNQWDADELIYIDITRSGSHDRRREDQGLENPDSVLDIIPLVASKAFMPLTFGGNIRTLQDIAARLERGADKVTLNTAALEDVTFISKAAERFGSQAIVVSIDAKQSAKGGWRVYSRHGTAESPWSPDEWAREAESRGAGEIFLNSIDRDGAASGYDLDLIKSVVEATSIPVIACGGAGHVSHFEACLAGTGASAVAAGNYFHFKEMSYVLAKRKLKEKFGDIR
jgi:cyclase